MKAAEKSIPFIKRALIVDQSQEPQSSKSMDQWGSRLSNNGAQSRCCVPEPPVSKLTRNRLNTELPAADRSQPAHLLLRFQVVHVERQDFAKTVLGFGRFAESELGQANQVEAIHPVALLQIIFKKQEVGQRCRKVIHLDLGRQLAGGQIAKFVKQLRGSLFVPELFLCQRPIIRHGREPGLNRRRLFEIPSRSVRVAERLACEPCEIMQVVLGRQEMLALTQVGGVAPRALEVVESLVRPRRFQ